MPYQTSNGKVHDGKQKKMKSNGMKSGKCSLHLEVQRVQGRAVRIHYDCASVPQQRQAVIGYAESDAGSEDASRSEDNEVPRKKVKQSVNTTTPDPSTYTPRRTGNAATGSSSNTTLNSTRQETSETSENKRKRPPTGANPRSSQVSSEPP
ncbi:hypothetical protein N7463_010604 [Penicillium fimorum]|uniref:Uncharacterized protein n=1 Tax=Penicillium fimorum TaxID=1882269 RepID=A0A9W9XK67_9EURO|nr:hypothetical protein N7463_010604 [Penicillium fimorum]